MEKLVNEEHYNVHILENNRFKNNKIEVCFINNFDNNESVIRDVLFRMLFMGNKIYNTSRDISIKTEELYDSITYFKSDRYGTLDITKVYSKFLNVDYIKENNYLENNIKFIFDIIFNAEFKQNSLNFVINSIKTEVDELEEDAVNYARNEVAGVLDKNDFAYVNKEKVFRILDSLTIDILKEEYGKVLNDSSIEINIFTNKFNDDYLNLINKYAKFNNKKREYNPFNDTTLGKHEKRETKDFSQSQINQIYNLENLTEKERTYVVFLFEEILGGVTLDSKLNKKLREENSLCYGAYATYSRYDNRMFISTSVSKENIDKSIELISVVLKEMINITEDDLNKAKLRVVREFDEYINNMNYLLSIKFLSDLGFTVPVEEKIKNYNSVTLDEVKNIVNKIKLNTTYIMEGVKE